ncbi:head GIN domain-containing protein [Maribacter sp. 2-571]|uniref:head GIN domain-containing protein n=1 Tax=Maribacter sp. 2-571 TaxID=3417569 RepID=UPI003D345A38
MKQVLSLSLIALLSISCTAQWGKKIKGNGKSVNIERSVGEYDAIGVSGWFDVYLVDGNEGNLSLEGEENLLEYLVTEVKNGKLIIKVEKGYQLKPSNWDKGIRITVPVASIDEVTLSGSGDIVGEKTLKSDRFRTSMSGSGDITLTVETNEMEASMSGSGDITLSGQTDNFDVSVSGSGDVKAYDLEASKVDATVSGSADIKITVNKMLRARVSGSGDISYRGNPEKVDTKTSGSGDISKG